MMNMDLFIGYGNPNGGDKGHMTIRDNKNNTIMSMDVNSADYDHAAKLAGIAQSVPYEKLARFWMDEVFWSGYCPLSENRLNYGI